jgi:hypothetical protein
MQQSPSSTDSNILSEMPARSVFLVKHPYPILPGTEHIRRISLPHDWRPTNARDDREQINKAREAAEALFAPKKQLERMEAPTSTPSSPLQIEQPALRAPRIIAIPSTMPVAEEIVGPSTDPKPKSRRELRMRRVKVPATQHDRVRTLARYGMTLGEVADLYGVSLNVIERIVGEGSDDHSSVIE